LFVAFASSTLHSQIFTEEDISICNSKFRIAVEKNLSQKPINEIIIEIGKSFIGTDYAAHTLEISDSETLVINLRGLDCNTFVENVLALSRCIKKNKTTFENFQNELKSIRYRNGEIKDYTSRIHYFTDWIFENEYRCIIKNITNELGGEQRYLKLSFMSDHPEYYKHLKANPEFIPVIKKQEEEINNRRHYFIPQGKIESFESKIESGDLLAFTSTVEGLDVNHVCIAIRMDDNRIHLLHAPVPGSKVQITDLNIDEYVKKIEKDSGIIVVRALNPYNE
jgi:hypothetical protein